ncbi:MAG TPA: ATP-binding protein, partial [Blastocatellia bacterium]
KQSEESRDYLKSLLDSLVSGVVVIANEGLVTIANRSMVEQAGFDGRDPVGVGYKDLFRDNESLTQIISERLERGIPNHRYCGRVEMADRRLFDTYASPLSVRGEQQGLILVFVDVTEMDKAQRELTRNRTLSAVGQMTAQVAHEIKNPLGSINLAIDLLRRRSTAMSEDELEVIGVIERSIRHLGRIVGELLEFSRPKDLNLARININRMLDDVLPMVADRSSAKNIIFEKEFSDSLPAGEYDESELRKLFINLIINAIDASEPGQTIELRTRLDESGNLVVEVEDHGCGMDAETERRLFEPFYTTKKMGTGLGMAIAKKIAELHRGDLSVKSQKGKGTTISVRLPLTAAGAASAG